MKIYAPAPPVASVDLPAGLEACPIIAAHFFGIDAATLAAERAASPIFQRKVKKLVGLGERAVAELLAEIAARHDVADEIDAALVRFGRLDPRLVAAAGGDRFPAAPLHEVSR